ncbi:MAG: 2-oxoacid:acceptor oxidoreductase family protein [Chloroflexota bacterium]
MDERHELRLTGFGGQGIMLAGYIIGQAATVYEFKQATHIRDYGPEARGGSCRADVVISDKPVLYPYINAPNVLVAMSQAAYNKYRPGSRENSLIIIDEDLVKHRETKKDRLWSIPAQRIAEDLGRANMANVVMLGFLTAVTGVVSIEAMRKSVLASVPKNTEELNLKALESGYTYGLAKVKARKGAGKPEPA